MNILDIVSLQPVHAMRTGRRKHALWTLYQEVCTSSSSVQVRKKAKCNYCAKEVEGQISRMMKHTQECNRTPISSKCKFARPVLLEKDDESERSSSVGSSSSSQTVLHQFYRGAFNQAASSSAYEHLVLALISGNVPWNFLENEHFQKFCLSIQPEFKILRRSKACLSVLPILHAKTNASIQSFVNRAEHLTMVSDSWTSPSCQNYSCWIIINENGGKEVLAVEKTCSTKKSEALLLM